MEDSDVAGGGGVAGSSNTIDVGNSGLADGGNNAYDAWGNGASGMSGNAAVVAHISNVVGSSVGNVVGSNNTYDAWGNGAAGTSGNAAILAHNSSGSNAIYVSTGNGAGDDDGESDIYRTLHGDARGDQSSTTNTQLYAIPMAEEEGGAAGGGSQRVGTFKLAGGQAGTIVAAAASGAYEVMVATDGIYAPVGGGRPRLLRLLCRCSYVADGMATVDAGQGDTLDTLCAWYRMALVAGSLAPPQLPALYVWAAGHSKLSHALHSNPVPAPPQYDPASQPVREEHSKTFFESEYCPVGHGIQIPCVLVLPPFQYDPALQPLRVEHDKSLPDLELEYWSSGHAVQVPFVLVFPPFQYDPALQPFRVEQIGALGFNEYFPPSHALQVPSTLGLSPS
eukprot:gene24964-30237_t